MNTLNKYLVEETPQISTLPYPILIPPILIPGRIDRSVPGVPSPE